MNSMGWMSVAGVAAITMANSVSASLVVYDGFNYTANTAVSTSVGTGTLNGGTNWSSSVRWWDNNNTDSNHYAVASGGLSYDSLTVGGNSLWQSTDNIGAARPLKADQSTIAEGTYYLSFLLRTSGNSASTANQYAGVQFGSAYFGLATQGGSGTTTRELVASNSYGNGLNGSTRVFSGVTVSPNTTYFLLAKVEFSASGADSYSLWVNPVVNNEANAGTAQAINTATVTSSITQVAMYSSSNVFGLAVDEIRLGTTWGDVTPGLPTSIPEPVGLGLLGIVAFTSLRRHRGS